MDKWDNPIMQPGKVTKAEAYCSYCRETVQPKIISLKGGLAYGRYRTIHRHLYLCPFCGGTVAPHTKEAPGGAQRIGGAYYMHSHGRRSERWVEPPK